MNKFESDASTVKGLIHVYKSGGNSFEQMAGMVEPELSRRPELEAIVRETPDIWEMLVARRARCKQEGVDFQQVGTMFMTMHINNEIAKLFKINCLANVTCTIPHGDGFDMVNGNATLSNWGALYQMVLGIYARWKGEFNDPNKKGDVCELVIGVFSPYGEKVVSRWIYGSQSTPPPDEIVQFVGQCELVAKSIAVGNRS